MHIHQDNKISYRRWILETLLITVLYYITGRLGQAIALPPGNVSLIWPPSGIALGIILLMGNRGLPGLWLGATLVNGLNFYTGAAEGVNQAAHKLKSSARSIGANDLADLCQSLETAGKGDDWDSIEKNVPTVDVLMNDVENYINNL